jgi:F0F1-type ATP synthase alpha subunit
VLQLLAGTAGLFDDLDRPHVGPFTKAMTDHFLANKPELLAEIVEKKTLKDGKLRERLLEEITKFKSTWKA